MRKQIVAGNWKMNNNTTKTIELINTLKKACDTDEKDVIFFVPSVNLIPAVLETKDTNIKIGCQNMHFLDNGAYTGEISADMLLDIGVSYVLVGHSERRQYFNETDEIVNKKVLKAIEKGITPILCVGENLEDREKNITNELVRLQVKTALYGVSREDAMNIIIAYEPIWAIGTGKTATKEQAEEVCLVIRNSIIDIYDQETASKIRIQYGGSVTKETAKELFEMENIDGGLVGGASLKPDFSQIVLA